MAKVDITVAIEGVVHAAARQLAMTILKEHGIYVRSIEFEWLDLQTPTEVGKLLMGVTALTETMGGTAEANVTEIPLEATIEPWVKKREKTVKPEFTIVDVVTDCLKLRPEQVTRDMQTRIGMALKKIGLTRILRRPGAPVYKRRKGVAK